MSSTLHIVGIAGSLRQNSYNKFVLQVAREMLPEGTELEIVPLDDLPLFNQDLENDPPAPVAIFKEKIRQADALLIVTPEYNYSVPGVLKNAIDWGSRPLGKSVFAGKLAAIMGAGGRFGTVRAQLHLRQILHYLDVVVVPKPEVLIMNAWEKFDREGNLLDEQARQFMQTLLDNLVTLAYQQTGKREEVAGNRVNS